MKKDEGLCCCGSGFPTFAVIILVIGVSWLLNDLNVFSFNIPWFPLILIILAIAWIVNYYKNRE